MPKPTVLVYEPPVLDPAVIEPLIAYFRDQYQPIAEKRNNDFCCAEDAADAIDGVPDQLFTILRFTYLEDSK